MSGDLFGCCRLGFPYMKGLKGQPGNLNPKPEALNPKPEALNPKP